MIEGLTNNSGLFAMGGTSNLDAPEVTTTTTEDNVPSVDELVKQADQIAPASASPLGQGRAMMWYRANRRLFWAVVIAFLVGHLTMYYGLKHN